MKKYISLVKKIPPRHYWSIFVFLSLYFIVPMSEIVVTISAILYYKYNKTAERLVGSITKHIPDWIKYGGSVLFFLVMIDDTFFYMLLIALAFWSAKQVKKENVSDQKSLSDESLDKS